MAMVNIKAPIKSTKERVLSVRVSDDVYRRYRDDCRRHNVSMSEAPREAVMRCLGMGNRAKYDQTLLMMPEVSDTYE